MSLEKIETQFADHVRAIEAVAQTMAPEIDRFSHLLAQALRSRQKILVMGNGGSAANSQHLAAEMVGRFMKDRKALPVIALTTDTSILTAVGNDYGFEEVFRRQVEALASSGDVVVGISTSGASNNVLQALAAANRIGCVTVGLLGRDGGTISKVVQLNLTVPLHETPRIQEAHLLIIHILCDVVETMFFP